MKPLFALLLSLSFTTFAKSQTDTSWNGKKCAVVLTYDDAIDVDIDNVLPALDSFNFKGTFYIIGASPVVAKRMDAWRKAAKNGHELGNHALFHPCDGRLPGRSFVGPDTDLSKYTVSRAVSEIRQNNTLLKAIDGKDTRTFAYPCGDLKIGDSLFYSSLHNDFSGARGVNQGLQHASEINIDNINSYMIHDKPASYMIDLVKQAQRTGTLLVFLFHGVGGGHPLNVSLDAHSALLHYLKQNEKDIWIATMNDVALKIRAIQNKH